MWAHSLESQVVRAWLAGVRHARSCAVTEFELNGGIVPCGFVLRLLALGVVKACVNTSYLGCENQQQSGDRRCVSEI